METNQFEKKIQKLFRGYRLEQYRESRIGGFVEFWLVDEVSPANTSVDLVQLKQLATLLNSESISITGGNFGDDNEHTNVLLTTPGVSFSKPRKARR